MRSIFLIYLLLVTQPVLAMSGYYRYPALHNDTLVFTAEGDLWTTTLGEKYAKRLTTHPAEEIESSISPDGNWVAFVANYSGASEVHVMPIQGGLAKRITFENVRVKVQGWSADSKVLYSYNGRVGPAGNWTLKQVDPVTLITTTIPLADAVEGTITTDGNTLFFTQFGLQISNDNARAYQGGAKGELWKYKLGSNEEATQLTVKHKGSARTPMISGERLYFISNQSGSDNIWSMKLNGRDQQQHTQYQDWEVRTARLNNNKIVYQLGADIKIFDISSGQSSVVDIALTSDFPELREHWVNDPLKNLTSAKQAGDTKKVLLTARGRVAIAATDGSRLIEIATPEDSRTRKALLSHDKKSVYALNDSSGEMEIWQYPADGSQGGEQLTFDGKIFRWDLYLSPDGKSIAHDDKNGDLWLLNIASKKNEKVLSNSVGNFPIDSLAWSSNSQLIAITYTEVKAERSQILLIDTLNNKHQTLTSEKYASFSPAFSSDTNWLYFLSDRHFDSFPNSPWGDRNMGASFDRRTEIFAIALKEEAKFPFEQPTELDGLDTQKDPEVDNEKDQADGQKDTDSSEEKTTADQPKIAVDWQNINDRLWQVPVASGNYSKMLANKKFLYVLDKITEPNSQAELKSIKIEPKSKSSTFLGSVQSFGLSDDGQTLFLQKTGSKKDMYLVSANAKFSSTAKDTKVNTSDWKLHVNPQQEWQQIFHDAWLMHRDSLFDKNMRGLDWSAVKQKYQPLLARLTDRNELNDIFKQMMGELNTLHSQVRGGDLPKDNNTAKAATLGAEYSQDKQGVKIEHIYSNDPELISRLSPLAKPGVNAKVGDIISAINGQSIQTIPDIAKALQNQAGKQVLLSLTRATEQLKTVVKPSSTRDDYYNRYFDWVTQNQQKVHQANDELGYLHLRAMGAGDVANFAREFYAQYKKQGLIIDVRRNNGGNVDSWILEKLLKRAWSFWQVRGGESFTNMQQTFRGHLVVLADQFTYSDGETFTAGIKALKLGTVIGKQTAGAGVWLSGRNRQTDGGMSRVAEYPVYAIDGRWITEGRGISPDIEVDNLPYATFNGEDAQLQAAIKLLQKKINKDPVKPLKVRSFPKVNVPADDIID
ncbi:S41 family peptidase [Paraglaciecola arctica]|uniref:Tricorn protease homolog n=1 Tax=Paraglaciecola arctica BSs20135 TaxID=493475 RepID=K6XNC2_9ALTE|nr:S41 family peptidase [Paraglaciecola arctica]GAC22164.1 tricorn protease [Paraglaciecola arctica BSs20135]